MQEKGEAESSVTLPDKRTCRVTDHSTWARPLSPDRQGQRCVGRGCAPAFYVMGALPVLFDFLFIVQNARKAILLSKGNYVQSAEPSELICA